MGFFQTEWSAFMAYIRRPYLVPATSWQSNSHYADWRIQTPWRRLWQWLLLLWGVNIVLLGPLALWVANTVGATHQLQGEVWALLAFAVFFAPISEEFVFRYSLRYPLAALWIVPSWLFLLTMGLSWQGVTVFALAIAWVLWRRPQVTPRYQQGYVDAFPWVFHGSVIAFAMIHWRNYDFETSVQYWWLLPILILPQWFTGMVLAWFRMRDSMLTAVLLHMGFNAGPLLLVVLAGGLAD